VREKDYDLILLDVDLPGWTASKRSEGFAVG
jgi:DNA-binding response OmpR family regulator